MTIEVDKVKHEGTALYKAGCEAVVSDASATSTFEKMISTAYTHSTVETFHQEVKETEKQIKKDFEITSMPSPWRSAKSVIYSAMKLNIKLIDDNGCFVGKTYLQTQIKKMRSETKVEWTEETYAQKVINLLINIPEELKARLVFQTVEEFIATK